MNEQQLAERRRVIEAGTEAAYRAQGAAYSRKWDAVPDSRKVDARKAFEAGAVAAGLLPPLPPAPPPPPPVPGLKEAEVAAEKWVSISEDNPGWFRVHIGGVHMNTFGSPASAETYRNLHVKALAPLLAARDAGHAEELARVNAVVKALDEDRAKLKAELAEAKKWRVVMQNEAEGYDLAWVDAPEVMMHKILYTNSKRMMGKHAEALKANTVKCAEAAEKWYMAPNVRWLKEDLRAAVLAAGAGGADGRE